MSSCDCRNAGEQQRKYWKYNDKNEPPRPICNKKFTLSVICSSANRIELIDFTQRLIRGLYYDNYDTLSQALAQYIIEHESTVLKEQIYLYSVTL